MCTERGSQNEAITVPMPPLPPPPAEVLEEKDEGKAEVNFDWEVQITHATSSDWGR